MLSRLLLNGRRIPRLVGARRPTRHCGHCSTIRSSTAHNQNDLKKLTIGVVGAGSFGRMHCATVRQCGEVRLAAIVDQAADALEHAAVEFPEVPLYASLGEALDAPLCDAYIVASSSSSHVLLTLRPATPPHCSGGAVALWGLPPTKLRVV